MDTPDYKTALIVGAGEGLSASLARIFSREKINVALAARKIEKLGALCRETGAHAYACNAADPDEVERLFGLVEREIASPDLVVYNASGRSRGAFVDLVPSEVANAIAVSAYGGFLVAQQAARRMLPNKHGAILFTGASASVKGYAQSARCAGWRRAWRANCRRRASMSRISSSTAASAARRGPSRPTGRIRCSIPTQSPRAIGTCCSSRAAPGAGSSSCGPGWRSFELSASFRGGPQDRTRNLEI